MRREKGLRHRHIYTGAVTVTVHRIKRHGHSHSTHNQKTQTKGPTTIQSKKSQAQLLPLKLAMEWLRGVKNAHAQPKGWGQRQKGICTEKVTFTTGKGKEREHTRDVFCEGSLFPYQSSLNSGLSSMAVRPTVQAQHKQYTTTHTGIHQTSPREQNKNTNEQTTEEQRLNNKETYKHIKSMHT